MRSANRMSSMITIATHKINITDPGSTWYEKHTFSNVSMEKFCGGKVARNFGIGILIL